jgi:hypothetical protein
VRTVWLPGHSQPQSAGMLPFSTVLRATMEGASAQAPLVLTFGPPPVKPPQKGQRSLQCEDAITPEAPASVSQQSGARDPEPGLEANGGGRLASGLAGFGLNLGGRLEGLGERLGVGASVGFGRGGGVLSGVAGGIDRVLPKSILERAAENPEAVRDNLRVLDSGVEKLSDAGMFVETTFNPSNSKVCRFSKKITFCALRQGVKWLVCGCGRADGGSSRDH